MGTAISISQIKKPGPERDRGAHLVSGGVRSNEILFYAQNLAKMTKAVTPTDGENMGIAPGHGSIMAILGSHL